MTQLRQLDLDFGLAGTGMTRKDVQDQIGPVDNLAFQQVLQVAHLARRKLVVENHEIALDVPEKILQLVGFALADK